MRVLVTGGAGFIGSNLVDRLLAEGHEVDVVDDLSVGSLENLATARASGGALRFHNLDVTRPELIELVGLRRPEVVFHLAAQADVRVSVERPIFDAEVNVLGSLRVLEAARLASVRKVVFAASGGTLYGEPAPGSLPIAESHPHRPLSPYGVAKMAVLGYLVAYQELYGLQYTALALANVYGPRQDPYGEAGVIAIFAGNLVAGRRSTIFGDGTQTRDYVFVDDVCDAFSRAAERGSGQLFNIGTGVETSVAELYRTLARAGSSRQRARFAPPRPGELLRSSLDPSLAATELGWRPWTALADGIAATLAALSSKGPAS